MQINPKSVWLLSPRFFDLLARREEISRNGTLHQKQGLGSNALHKRFTSCSEAGVWFRAAWRNLQGEAGQEPLEQNDDPAASLSETQRDQFLAKQILIFTNALQTNAAQCHPYYITGS